MLVAQKREEHIKTNPYVKFLIKSKWQPMKVGVFAGKVDYPNLIFLIKL